MSGTTDICRKLKFQITKVLKSLFLVVSLKLSVHVFFLYEWNMMSVYERVLHSGKYIINVLYLAILTMFVAIKAIQF